MKITIFLFVPLERAICFPALSNTLDFYFCLIDGVVLVALLSGSAVISGTEAAFFSLSHKQITQFRNTHGPREKRVLQLLQHPRRLLGTILILNNLINVTFVTFSTYLLWKIVGTENVDHFIVLVYTFTSTIFIVLFGEVIPKIYATQNNLYWARHMAGLLTLAVPLLRPLSSLLLRVGSLLGKNLLQKKHDLSIDELSRALELTTTHGTSEGEKEILRGVVNFSSLAAKQIMQPRTEIKALDTAINFHQLMDLINKSVHSRFPVYRDTIDNIEGVLHTKDLLAHLDEDENFSWQTLLRKCLFVPENKKIDALLLDFQEKRVRMAIVVDEYGGTSGLITLEDIVEEIIGDITDEFNQDTALYQQLNDHTFVMESRISLNDFCKVVGESPTTFAEVKGESESLGGLLLELNGRLPHASEKISFQEFTFTIMAADTRKIKKVKVEITPDQEEVPQAN